MEAEGGGATLCYPVMLYPPQAGKSILKLIPTSTSDWSRLCHARSASPNAVSVAAILLAAASCPPGPSAPPSPAVPTRLPTELPGQERGFAGLFTVCPQPATATGCWRGLQSGPLPEEGEIGPPEVRPRVVEAAVSIKILSFGVG